MLVVAELRTFTPLIVRVCMPAFLEPVQPVRPTVKVVLAGTPAAVAPPLKNLLGNRAKLYVVVFTDWQRFALGLGLAKSVLVFALASESHQRIGAGKVNAPVLVDEQLRRFSESQNSPGRIE